MNPLPWFVAICLGVLALFVSSGFWWAFGVWLLIVLVASFING